MNLFNDIDINKYMAPDLIMSKKWEMPNPNTFNIKCIKIICNLNISL